MIKLYNLIRIVILNIKIYFKFSLFLLVFRCFIIKLPSESRGLIILPVTKSRGNSFGPLLPPIVVAFGPLLGAFPLLGEVVANV